MMNLRDDKVRLLLVFLILTILPWFASCKPEELEETALTNHGVILNPYLTATLTQSQKNKNQVTAPPTPTSFPSPSPTPFLYTIVEKDTLTSIAYRHGIQLKELIAANPSIDPNFLTIGMTLTIPITDNIYSNQPEPTPVPVNVQHPECYPEASGGQWCLSIITNNQSFDVENISARMNLTLPDATDPLSVEAVTPLNILPAGKSSILTAYFPPPLPEYLDSNITIASAIAVQEESQRYIELTIDDESIHIRNNKIQAEINGEISIQNEGLVAEYIWVAAFAVDEKRIPIGFRKWISVNPLNHGEIQHYQFILNSFGPAIKEVEILYEARRRVP
jgi:LysM repeat protein